MRPSTYRTWMVRPLLPAALVALQCLVLRIPMYETLRTYFKPPSIRLRLHCAQGHCLLRSRNLSDSPLEDGRRPRIPRCSIRQVIRYSTHSFAPHSSLAREVEDFPRYLTLDPTNHYSTFPTFTHLRQHLLQPPYPSFSNLVIAFRWLIPALPIQ